MVKPMALQQGRFVKRVNTGTAQLAKYEGTEEPEGMADAPIERLLKDIIKKQAPEVIEIESPKNPTGKRKMKILTVKKQPYSPRPDKKPKPSTSGYKPASGYKTPASSVIPKGLSPAAKKTLKELGWKEGDNSPKGGATGRKKLKKTEGEKLQEGYWGAWRKKLDYEEEDD